jgi:cellulose biosynthesis protein BcsQ
MVEITNDLKSRIETIGDMLHRRDLEQQVEEDAFKLRQLGYIDNTIPKSVHIREARRYRRSLICNMAKGCQSSCWHRTVHEHRPECDDPCPAHPAKCVKV